MLAGLFCNQAGHEIYLLAQWMLQEVDLRSLRHTSIKLQAALVHLAYQIYLGPTSFGRFLFVQGLRSVYSKLHVMQKQHYKLSVAVLKNLIEKSLKLNKLFLERYCSIIRRYIKH